MSWLRRPTFMLQVRLSEQQHATLVAVCDALDLNMSEVVRALVEREAERLG